MDTHLQNSYFFIDARDIIIEYDKLYQTYINFFNKIISKCLLLLFLSFFFRFFSISLNQFLYHWYFVLKYVPIFFYLSWYIHKIKLPIYLLKSIFSSLLRNSFLKKLYFYTSQNSYQGRLSHNHILLILLNTLSDHERSRMNLKWG